MIPYVKKNIRKILVREFKKSRFHQFGTATVDLT